MYIISNNYKIVYILTNNQNSMRVMPNHNIKIGTLKYKIRLSYYEYSEI